MSLLMAEKIFKNYDGIRVLDGISLKLEKGMVKGLIGPNGAGKSTLFHLISGVEKPDSGKIYFQGIDLVSLAPHEISVLGLGRTFQTLQILGNMTVVENIMTGMHKRLKEGFISGGLWLPWVRKEESVALKEAKEILEFLGLLGRWKWPASQLSFGEQKMLEMGRALAMKPELLLLDEPAAGLNPNELGKLAERISKLRASGMTIFIVEHHIGMVLEIADEIAVLHHGEIISEGVPDSVRKDQRVIDAYLKGKKSNA